MNKYVIDKYPITYYAGPPGTYADMRRFREIADAGFTHAFPLMSYDDGSGTVTMKDMNLKVLDLCRECGIKAVAHDSRIGGAVNGGDDWKRLLDGVVADYKDHPALHSYFLTDEPHVRLFERLGDIVSYLREKDPAHHAYINLFANFIMEEELLGIHSYDEYLERFVRAVKPDIISYDHYHFLKDFLEESRPVFASRIEELIYEASARKEGRPGFHENLESVRRVSLKYGIPFMVIVLLTSHGPFRDLTEAEIRWEVFQSLAYGASCISYFTYWTPPDDNWHYRNGAVTWDGELTAHYHMLKKVNRDLSVLGTRLMNLKSLAVKNAHGCEVCGGLGCISGENVTAGIFEGGYVLLANKDYDNPSRVTIKTREGYSLFKISKPEGNEIPVSSSNEDGIYASVIEPGDAELLRLIGTDV